jgi:hypothetical protein
MGATRLWTALSAATLGAALAVVVGAPAATHPSARVLGAKVSGASVAFTIDVTLSARACKGTVRLSAVRHHWKGTAKKSAGGCHARIHGRLPRAYYGRRLTFRIAFAGKSRTVRLQLVPPAPGGPTTTTTTTTATTTTTTTTTTGTTPTQTQPPAGSAPPDYVNGTWVASGAWTPPSTSNQQVQISGGVVHSVDARFPVKCGGDSLTFTYSFGYAYDTGVLPDGSFSGQYDKPVSGVPGAYAHLSASGTLAADGTGTLTVSMSGYDAGYNDCHATATGPLGKQP